MTASLASSVLNYRYGNGRRYHAYRDGQYHFPSDKYEQARAKFVPYYAEVKNVSPSYKILRLAAPSETVQVTWNGCEFRVDAQVKFDSDLLGFLSSSIGSCGETISEPRLLVEGLHSPAKFLSATNKQLRWATLTDSSPTSNMSFFTLLGLHFLL